MHVRHMVKFSKMIVEVTKSVLHVVKHIVHVEIDRNGIEELHIRNIVSRYFRTINGFIIGIIISNVWIVA